MEPDEPEAVSSVEVKENDGIDISLPISVVTNEKVEVVLVTTENVREVNFFEQKNVVKVKIN